ncbi:MAG: phosphotransferase [Bacilli bacterium]|nr:phosphotransferase [Bacilli bacterium]
MKIIESIIKSAFNEDAIDIEYIPLGLTNDNYKVTTNLGNKYIIRIPKKGNEKIFKYKNEELIILALKNENIDIQTLYYNNKNGVKITKYIENSRVFNESSLPIEKKIFIIAEKLRKIHGIKINSLKFNSLEKLNVFKGESLNLFSFEEIIIKNIKNQYSKNNLVLCHNDLVNGNLLFDNERLYIIDYEYAGMNNKMFDLASFLSENDITDEKTILDFLKYYYLDKYSNDIFEDLKIWYIFNDILWTYWAKYMLERDGKEIFSKIYYQKLNRANNLYNLWFKK